MVRIKMCYRTVEGNEEDTRRTVDGEDFIDRSVSGLDAGARNVSGVVSSGIVLLGTQPTFVELTTPSSGSYTTPNGCVYIEVYATGPGGGGAGGGSNAGRRSGGGGGAGACAFGMFAAGTYTYTVASGGAGGATTDLPGSAGSGPTIFGTMQAGSGAGGVAPLTADAVGYTAAASGITTNSLFSIGIIAADPPGFQGSNGGGNLFKALSGSGGFSLSAAVNGQIGLTGGGGGGGHQTASSGGTGGNGCITIIEYY
jgi:hypothetical protein